MIIQNWKQTFESLLREGQFAQAGSLKNVLFPERLYKYRHINEFTFNALTNNTIWIASQKV